MNEFREITNYTIEAAPHECYVDFIIYDETGLIESHAEAVKLGIDPENRGHLPEPYMLCSIKWDGCSCIYNTWNYTSATFLWIKTN